MYDVRIMDIAMNLARIGNWAADDFDGKQKRISMFLEQTGEYLGKMEFSTYPAETQKTLEKFTREFTDLRRQSLQQAEDRIRWAEAMLTWSNILTHRAKVKSNTI